MLRHDATSTVKKGFIVVFGQGNTLILFLGKAADILLLK